MAFGAGDWNLISVLTAAHKASENSTDQGNRYERLCQAVLTAHDGEDGTRRFKRVWLWSDDWPNKKPHDSADTGIDLIAEQLDGTLAAIQCKFYKGTVSTGAVDSFLAASSRPEFAARIFMTTGRGFQRHGLNKLNHAHPTCEVFDIQRMSTWQVDWWELAEQTKAVEPGTHRPDEQLTPKARLTAFATAAIGFVARYYTSVGSRYTAASLHPTRRQRVGWHGPHRR